MCCLNDFRHRQVSNGILWIIKDFKMPMKGRFPIRRTLEYLQKGDIIFKNRVKIMTVNYNTHGELSDGARSELTEANSVSPL